MDLDFHALRAFARTHGERRPEACDPFIEPYARPTLDLFNAHARAVIAENGLSRLRRKGRVEAVEASDSAVTVHTGRETLAADYLVLAVGRTELPARPPWARGLSHPRILHVFDPDFTPDLLDSADAPVVVGGGVTAAQVACHAAERSSRAVRMITRGSPVVEQFDSRPCFIGPRCLESFLATKSSDDRRRFIEEARRPGTMPWDVGRALSEESRVATIEDEVSDVEISGDTIRLHRADREHGHGETVETDLVILATGFEKAVPLEPIIKELSHRHELPRGPVGYPVPDRFLRWHPRVFVTGTLGELELGPAAPNIIGAHLAGRRLVPFFRSLNSGERTAHGGAAEPAEEIAWTALTRYLETG